MGRVFVFEKKKWFVNNVIGKYDIHKIHSEF